MTNEDEIKGTTVMRAPPGQAARYMVAEMSAAKPGLYIGADRNALKTMRNCLEFLAPDMPIIEIPDWDCPPYSGISPSFGCSAARIGALSRMANEDLGGIMHLATAATAMQKLVPRAELAASGLECRCGHRIGLEALSKRLSQLGFRKCGRVLERGEFAVRGSIVDVFPATASNPVRFDFFGDLIETIRIFSPETQMTIGRTEAVILSQVSEIVLTEERISFFRTKFREAFGAPRSVETMYENISSGIRHPGMEHWLPIFYPRLNHLIDFLPSARIWIDDRVAGSCRKFEEGVTASYESRLASPTGSAVRSTVLSPPCAPATLFLSTAELMDQLNRRKVECFSPVRQVATTGCIDAGAELGRNFFAERESQNSSLMACVAEHILEVAQSDHVVIAADSEGSRDRLRVMLEDEGVADTGLLQAGDSLNLPPGQINVAAWPIDAGFRAAGLTVISEHDIFGERLIRKSRRRKGAGALIAESANFMPGDLLVHRDYGIGRFTGLETIHAGNAAHDFFVLRFAGDADLYVPVENSDLLTPYGYGDASLDRLGAAAWQRRKADLMKDVLAIADDLISVAAARELNRAERYLAIDDSLTDFRSKAGFDDTEDQADAEREVLDDIASGKPMDRLICGDVGFGKTEIAMRAAFVVAAGGGQVAVIAPTTLLVRQHFETFTNRFRQYPINISQLSRLCSATEAAKIREDTAAGRVDILIGTHAILSEATAFRNLGLIVVDEEQSFGVDQKEILKRACSKVHVLSMTATPIPRTLHMALSGVRDISLISTAPDGRLPIRTFVSEFDQSMMRNALLHESFRGGQSFVIVPRIKDLPEMERFLREWVPEISFLTAHGRLDTRTLEERANAFYEGKCGIFLSTTIIAAGIDIANANTIIIHNSHRFGLAQLYQLRGRVGRSGRAAYAYILHPPARQLTPQAMQRLRILGNLESLGMGHSVAARDLDMRGGGNLLGEAQSGHVKAVGYELYQSMLADALNKLKDGHRESIPEDHWSPQLQLNVSVMIPETYVSDLETRLDLYRRFGRLTHHDEIEAIGAELIDRFGPLPEQVIMLMHLLRVRIDCRAADIGQVEAGPKGTVFTFRESAASNFEALFDFVAARSDGTRFTKNGIFLPASHQSPKTRIREIHSVVRRIASLMPQTEPTTSSSKLPSRKPAVNGQSPERHSSAAISAPTDAASIAARS